MKLALDYSNWTFNLLVRLGLDENLHYLCDITSSLRGAGLKRPETSQSCSILFYYQVTADPM